MRGRRILNRLFANGVLYKKMTAARYEILLLSIYVNRIRCYCRVCVG